MRDTTIDPVFEEPISNADFSKVKTNFHGIRCQKITIPAQRDGINEWFKKFSV